MPALAEALGALARFGVPAAPALLPAVARCVADRLRTPDRVRLRPLAVLMVALSRARYYDAALTAEVLRTVAANRPTLRPTVAGYLLLLCALRRCRRADRRARTQDGFFFLAAGKLKPAIGRMTPYQLAMTFSIYASLSTPDRALLDLLFRFLFHGRAEWTQRAIGAWPNFLTFLQPLQQR